VNSLTHDKLHHHGGEAAAHYGVGEVAGTDRDGSQRRGVRVGVGAGTATQQLGATAAIWRGAEKIVAKSWHLSVMNVFLPCFQL
jgi:hypothetical protein